MIKKNYDFFEKYQTRNDLDKCFWSFYLSTKRKNNNYEIKLELKLKLFIVENKGTGKAFE